MSVSDVARVDRTIALPRARAYVRYSLQTQNQRACLLGYYCTGPYYTSYNCQFHQPGAFYWSLRPCHSLCIFRYTPPKMVNRDVRILHQSALFVAKSQKLIKAGPEQHGRDSILCQARTHCAASFISCMPLPQLYQLAEI